MAVEIIHLTKSLAYFSFKVLSLQNMQIIHDIPQHVLDDNFVPNYQNLADVIF